MDLSNDADSHSLLNDLDSERGIVCVKALLNLTNIGSSDIAMKDVEMVRVAHCFCVL